MEKARLRIDYELPTTDSARQIEQTRLYLPSDDFARRAGQIGNSGQALVDTIQKYSLNGHIETRGPTLSLRLIQEPQILRTAFKELINSELGAPSRIYPGSESRFSGIGDLEEKQGFEIAKEVLGSAEYELKPHHSIFHVFSFLPEYYTVEKK